MKNIYFLVLFLSLFTITYSQNIQLHYDFGEDRKMFTTTTELFKVDKLGNTFFFIDFDFGGKAAKVSGVSNAYWELAREFNIGNSPFAAHAEFNAGMFRTNTFNSEINNAMLLGVTYSFHSEDYSKTLSIQTLYKGIQDKQAISFQLTAVWGMHFFDNQLSFNGFADFWREDVFVFDGTGTGSEAKFVFLAEPQIWYNFSTSFSLGSELEVSNNFGGHKGLMINPTLALKWNI